MKKKLNRSSARIKPAADRIAQAKGWRGDASASSSARGYTYEWQCYRIAFLAEHPICMIQGEGCTLSADVVDHIKPHRGDMVLFWNPANHQSACTHCHSMHKQKQEHAALHGYSA